MKTYGKSLLAGTMAASLALGAAAMPTMAVAEPASDPTPTSGAQAADGTAAPQSATTPGTIVEGSFAFTQDRITPTAVIREVFQKATAALCGATDDFSQVNPLGWKVSVTGEVNAAFTAPVDEIASESSVQNVMTCTCGGNPADGAATITAEVKGIPVTHLLDRADARAGANTLTFVASDGTEAAMPLAYVVGHHGVLSYEINGENLSASVGGNNQLWLTGTPANYFLRDIVEIRVSCENEPPAAPGESQKFPNSPNVGVLAATVS